MTRSWNKVFEVGSPKTGTTSLGHAYRILGLGHKGWDLELDRCYRRGDFAPILKAAEEFEAFEDGPWHRHGMHEILDHAFPNSKFILLERDLGDWIRSYRAHFEGTSQLHNTPPELKRNNFDQTVDQIVSAHLSKYERVKTYFRDRPNDLLVMNVCGGEGWEKLCPFLELEPPDQPFPCVNRTANVIARNQRKQAIKRRSRLTNWLRIPTWTTSPPGSRKLSS